MGWANQTTHCPDGEEHPSTATRESGIKFCTRCHGVISGPVPSPTPSRKLICPITTKRHQWYLIKEGDELRHKCRACRVIVEDGDIGSRRASTGGSRIRKIRWLAERDGNECHYCHVPFTAVLRATLDHIVPRALGGTNDCENLVLACDVCNHEKADAVEYTPTPLLQETA